MGRSFFCPKPMKAFFNQTLKAQQGIFFSQLKSDKTNFVFGYDDSDRDEGNHDDENVNSNDGGSDNFFLVFIVISRNFKGKQPLQPQPQPRQPVLQPLG